MRAHYEWHGRTVTDMDMGGGQSLRASVLLLSLYLNKIYLK